MPVPVLTSYLASERVYDALLQGIYKIFILQNSLAFLAGNKLIHAAAIVPLDNTVFIDTVFCVETGG